MQSFRIRLSMISLALGSGVLFGLAALVLIVLAPRWELHAAVRSLGLSQIVPALAPPLGMKARVLLALLAAGLVGGMAFTLAAIAEQALRKGRAPHFVPKPSPKLRPKGRDARADAPIFVPERAPIFADRELGAPLMSDAALARSRATESWDEPANWDGAGHHPLAAAVPVAAPPAPVSPDPMPAALAPIVAPRMAPAMPDPAPAPAPAPAPVAQPSPISALETELRAALTIPQKPSAGPASGEYDHLSLNEMIARLEESIAKRQPQPPLPPASAAIPEASAALPPVAPPLAIVGHPSDGATPATPTTPSAGEADLEAVMGRLRKLVG